MNSDGSYSLKKKQNKTDWRLRGCAHEPSEMGKMAVTRWKVRILKIGNEKLF
jgi:hypothetical protein